MSIRSKAISVNSLLHYIDTHQDENGGMTPADVNELIHKISNTDIFNCSHGSSDNISSIMRARRKQMGLSLKEASIRSRVSWRTIENIERGFNTTLETASWILDALGLKLEIIEKED